MQSHAALEVGAVVEIVRRRLFGHRERARKLRRRRKDGQRFVKVFFDIGPKVQRSAWDQQCARCCAQTARSSRGAFCASLSTTGRENKHARPRGNRPATARRTSGARRHAPCGRSPVRASPTGRPRIGRSGLPARCRENYAPAWPRRHSPETGPFRSPPRLPAALRDRKSPRIPRLRQCIEWDQNGARDQAADQVCEVRGGPCEIST